MAAQGPALLAQGHIPVASVGGVPALGVGAWRGPVGWKPHHMWTGEIIEYAPPDYVVPKIGPNRGKRNYDLPASLQEPRRAPRLVEVTTYQQEVSINKINAADGRPIWIDAERMPDELKDMMLDCYGEDLTPAQRAIVASRIPEWRAKKAAERKAAEAEKEKAEARPVPTDRTPRDAAKSRAGQSPTKRLENPTCACGQRPGEVEVPGKGWTCKPCFAVLKAFMASLADPPAPTKAASKKRRRS